MLIVLNLALALETLVLIASLFLLIYINKNQLSKWYRYAGIAIVVFIGGLMICTMGAGCRMACHHRMGMSECEMGGGQRMNMMFMHRGMGECSEGMSGCEEERMECRRGFEGRMHRGGCDMEMKGNCEMREKEGCCEEGMHKGKCEKEQKECEHKCSPDSAKKEMMIKKK